MAGRDASRVHPLVPDEWTDRVANLPGRVRTHTLHLHFKVACRNKVRRHESRLDPGSEHAKCGQPRKLSG